MSAVWDHLSAAIQLDLQSTAPDEWSVLHGHVSKHFYGRKILDNIQGVLCTHNTIIYPVEPHLNLCWYSSFSHFYDASIWRISRQPWCKRHIKWNNCFLLCVRGGQAASSCINASLMCSHVKIVLIAGVWNTDYNFQAFWRDGNSVKAAKDSF